MGHTVRLERKAQGPRPQWARVVLFRTLKMSVFFFLMKKKKEIGVTLLALFKTCKKSYWILD